MRKRSVAVVGATGIAGQQFLVALADHPWFDVTLLAASARSAGRPYGEAIRDANGARRWWCSEEPAANVLSLPVEDAAHLDAGRVDLVFAAVESDVARELEPRYARAVPVVSTAAAFRYEPDVPIALPGVNLAAHLPLVEQQRQRRGWKGFILPLPNCTTVGLAISPKPLLDGFGLDRVLMTSMQGLSGAGRSPGVIALDIVDNVIPYIPKAEEKVATETAKILGTVVGETVVPASFPVSATCTRVPVLDAHTEVVYVSTRERPTVDEVKEVFKDYGKEFVGLKLPSCP